MFVFLGQGCSLQTKPVTSSGLSLERLSEGLGFFFQEVFLIEQGEGEGRVGNHRPGSFFLPLAIGLESPKKDRRIVFKASFFRGELSNFGGW